MTSMTQQQATSLEQEAARSQTAASTSKSLHRLTPAVQLYAWGRHYEDSEVRVGVVAAGGGTVTVPYLLLLSWLPLLTLPCSCLYSRRWLNWWRRLEGL